MTEYIKTKIQQRDNIYKNYLKSSKNNQDFQYLKSAIDDVSNTICKRNSDYYNQLAHQKFIDPTTNSFGQDILVYLKNFCKWKKNTSNTST